MAAEVYEILDFLEYSEPISDFCADLPLRTFSKVVISFISARLSAFTFCFERYSATICLTASFLL